MPTIHPTALVEQGASIADDAVVGAYAIVGPEVSIGAGTTIGPHAVVTGRTRIGRRNRIFQFASVGDVPQDRKYGGEPTRCVLGDDNVVREFVSIHAGTAQDRGETTIGNGNWFLAYTHIAHDCVIGDHVTFSNGVQVAGHVHVGDYATFGGFAGVHQFCRIGAQTMIAAAAIVLQDVPPYVTVAGSPARPAGTNSEGLRRRGFAAADIALVKRAYRTLYRQGLSLEEAKAALARDAQDAPVLEPLVAFLAASSNRGILRPEA